MKRKRSIPGLPPGTIHDINGKNLYFPVIVYNEQEVFEKEITEINQLKEILEPEKNTWIQVKEIQKSNVVKKIGTHFALHPLILEDIMDTNQRPKINDFGDYLFLVINIPFLDKITGKMFVQQISLVLGKNFVITFQESDASFFLPIQERLFKNKGHIRNMKSDYLAYALIDFIVDHFFLVIEEMEERIDTLENSISTNDSPEIMHTLHKNKQVVIALRKSILAIREIIRNLEKRDISLIQEETLPFLRDLYEHTIQIMESIEMFREILSSIHDVYLSIVSNKLNEVMKVLTIFASIFIPLTFLAGLYGMNFKYMPELQWPWTYPVLLGVMFIITGVMLLYFKKKGWIWGNREKKKR
ncbi:MAG: magnesium/cobalt transporter CorA [Spirochaetales bacterium]|nr:magnesium/cobalt transporter CorA [Spirochaetales bacterium]